MTRTHVQAFTQQANDHLRIVLLTVKLGNLEL